jgi:hypothetical protein
METNHSLGRMQLYFLGALGAAVLGLGGYVWTQTQAEISAQRLVDDITTKRVEMLAHELDTKFHTLTNQLGLEQERMSQMRDILIRFRAIYDRKESQTDENLKLLHQQIIELQQKTQSSADRLIHLEKAQRPTRDTP